MKIYAELVNYSGHLSYLNYAGQKANCILIFFQVCSRQSACFMRDNTPILCSCQNGVYVAKRTRIEPEIFKSKRCECCGYYGYSIQRHNTRNFAKTTRTVRYKNDCPLCQNN